MSSVFFLLALVLLVLYWSRETPTGLDAAEQARFELWKQVLSYETQQVNATDAHSTLERLNLTGVVQSQNASTYSEFIPGPIGPEILDFWTGKDYHTYYRNISSILHGHYSMAEHVDPMPLDLSKFNATLDNYTLDVPDWGKIALYVGETIEQNYTRLVSADFSLADNDPVALRGVYLPGGRVAMATSSIKFKGFKALPWITPPTVGLEDTRALILDQIGMEPTYRDFVNQIAEASQCEWVLWGRMEPVGLNRSELNKVEDELEDPVGRPHAATPPVGLTGVLYSPDCGAAFRVNVEGERSEHYRQRLRHGLVWLLLVFVAAHTLTIFQVQRINTPTTNYRVSFWCVALMTLADGLVCMTCMLANYEKQFALQLMAIVVEVFCFITIIQLEYLVGIFQVQLRDGGRHADLNQSQITSLIYGRLYLVLLVLCLVSVSSYSFTEANRSTYEWMLCIALFSNWWPQIWRNVRRGISQPFRLRYIYGISLLRLAPVLYICFYPNNVGYHHYAPTLGWSIMAWQWLQVLLLNAQYTLGGQFFLPEWLCSDVYDYHPIVTGDLETLLEEPECAICMSPVALVSSSAPSEMLARRKYMITPCRHVFHTPCLEEWTRRKLECPVCRSSLPCN